MVNRATLKRILRGDPISGAWLSAVADGARDSGKPFGNRVFEEQSGPVARGNGRSRQNWMRCQSSSYIPPYSIVEITGATLNADGITLLVDLPDDTNSTNRVYAGNEIYQIGAGRFGWVRILNLYSPVLVRSTSSSVELLTPLDPRTDGQVEPTTNTNSSLIALTSRREVDKLIAVGAMDTPTATAPAPYIIVEMTEDLSGDVAVYQGAYDVFRARPAVLQEVDTDVYDWVTSSEPGNVGWDIYTNFMSGVHFTGDLINVWSVDDKLVTAGDGRGCCYYFDDCVYHEGDTATINILTPEAVVAPTSWRYGADPPVVPAVARFGELFDGAACSLIFDGNKQRFTALQGNCDGVA